MQSLRSASRRVYANLQLRNLRCLSTATEPLSQSPHDNYVEIVEVGPRDGLQNEKKSIPLATKIELIERLAGTGLTDIEAGSFVSPKWVPQMADSSQILSHILQTSPSSDRSIAYSFLTPNTRGLEDALSILSANPKSYQTQTSPIQTDNDDDRNSTSSSPPPPSIEFSVFAAATESFSQKNLNCSISDSLTRFRPVITQAKSSGLRIRAYISVVLGCPFEGTDIPPSHVASLACSLLSMGADEISLGDTTGMGTAPRTAELLKAMTAAGIRSEDLTMHFHDTYGQALVNSAVSLEHGVRRFDASVGGLGGCPYSPGATGNVSTEDLVYFLESLGMQTGADLEALCEIGEWISGEVGRENASSVGRAVLGRRRREISQEE